jgi:glycosyltransferase involved in cell wall biosynthesis
MQPQPPGSAKCAEQDAAACLAVLIPCYNEAGTIDELLRRVLAQPEVAEVIVVDDGSTDGSWERLQAWPARDGRVRLARQPRNLGKGAAVRRALGLATAPVVVVQDADLEYDPSDYARLLEPIRSGEAQVVYGTRFGPGSQARSPWWHRWANRLLTAVANGLTGLHLTDEATCYKMLLRQLALDLDLQEDGFGLCPELTAKLARRGVPIVEVPIRYQGRSRVQGKKLRLRHGLEAVRCLWKYAHGADPSSGKPTG